MPQSWHLENADQRAKESKYTFYKPSQTIINKLQPGNLCKLIFNFNDDNPDNIRAERMWVIIDEIVNGKFTGHLDNDPYYIKDLKEGDLIHFESKHIINLNMEDNEPNIVEKYSDRCFATKRIIYDNGRIGYFYREEPIEGEIDGYKDSGWRFLEGNEGQEYLDNSDNAQFVS